MRLVVLPAFGGVKRRGVTLGQGAGVSPGLTFLTVLPVTGPITTGPDGPEGLLCAKAAKGVALAESHIRPAQRQDFKVPVRGNLPQIVIPLMTMPNPSFFIFASFAKIRGFGQ
jgi:hypothetical protein